MKKEEKKENAEGQERKGRRRVESQERHEGELIVWCLVGCEMDFDVEFDLLVSVLSLTSPVVWVDVEKHLASSHMLLTLRAYIHRARIALTLPQAIRFLLCMHCSVCSG